MYMKENWRTSRICRHFKFKSKIISENSITLEERLEKNERFEARLLKSLKNGRVVVMKMSK